MEIGQHSCPHFLDTSKKHSIKSKEFLNWLERQLIRNHRREFVFLMEVNEWTLENIQECLSLLGRKDLSLELSNLFF